MSKYSSLCTAINVFEAMAKVIGEERTEKTKSVIQDLQDVAKDVRYGGKWDGDYEILAECLELCVNTGRNCAACAYRKHPESCRANLKKDAAAAIRQMGKNLKDMEAMIQSDQDVRPAADWQVKIMQGQDILPWDEDETEAEERA